MKKILLLVMLIWTTSRAQQIEITVQKGHSAEIQFITFNAKGHLLASSGADNLIKLWHVPTGKEMVSFVSGSTLPVKSIAFSEEDDFLYVLYADGAIHTWDIANSSLKSTEKPAKEIRFPDQRIYNTRDSLFRFSIDHFRLEKTKLKDGRMEFTKVPVDISRNFTSLSVSEKNKRLVGACEDGKVYVYDSEKGKNLFTLDQHYDAVNSVCFAPDEEIFATASADRSIILWDAKTMKPVRRLFSRSFRLECLAFDHAGTHLAVGDELGKGNIIDLQSSRIKVSTYSWHDQKISAIRFSPDDTLLYSAGYDNRLNVFDLRRGKVIKREVYRDYWSTGDLFLKKLKAYREPFAWINALDVSPDGRHLVAGGAWKESVLRKQPQRILFEDHLASFVKGVVAHQGTINCLAFLGDLSFVSGSASTLLTWFYNPGDRNFYFRKNDFPKGTDIHGIARISADTLLINGSGALIWYDLKNEKIIQTLNKGKTITAIGSDRNEHRIAYAVFDDLIIANSDGTREMTIKNAHTDKITAIAFSPTRPILATTSWDATVKLWNSLTGELMVTVIPMGKEEHIIITPDNYYFGTRNSLKGIGFKFGKEFISPEQFDLRFNRPDLVLKRLGFAPANVVNSYRRAYEKRLQRMNFTEQMLGTEIHLPEIRITTEELPLNTTEPTIHFAVEASDARFKLDRINVFVNNIPVYGIQGIDLRAAGKQTVRRDIDTQLSLGKNKIQVSCLNEKGVESLLQTFEIDYQQVKPKPNLYLAVISVSRYANSKMNLKYAVKDGHDLVHLYVHKAERYSHIFVDTLFNELAIKENILSLKKKFAGAKVDDEIILFASGHGLLDDNLDFYFGTADVDFNNPDARGLKYEDLETLLDGIPARKKLLMIDACHSGEVDKTQLKVSTDQTIALTKNTRGVVKTYSYQSENAEEQYQVGIKTSFELMQELFANVSKGSGAVVISAAAGNSYALESDEWKNGIFTYCVLHGLKNRTADLNKDGSITVSELKEFVSKEVDRLTQGAQRPTSRSENLEFDFVVW